MSFFQEDVTNRNFNILRFKDRYGHDCSIQESSLATEDTIWFGLDKSNPMIMVSDANRLGLPTNGKTTGWMPYDIPNEVHFNTRMHLTREQAMELIPVLRRFVETGEL